MENKLTILVLVRKFWIKFPKHKSKFDVFKSMEKYADVHYWYDDGDIQDVIQKLNIHPDFILHYDIAWKNALAPNITGLDQVNIPKGCIVIDIHFHPSVRERYFQSNDIDLIFSVTKSAFLKAYPTYEDKFRWFPFSINPTVFRDWKQEKKNNFLLMGKVHDPAGIYPNIPKTPKGKYKFREEVLNKMRDIEGFVFHPHPGDIPSNLTKGMYGENYAIEINRSKIFFTCGSILKYPVLKYFEVPACRTLLLAEFVEDIEDLGFIDGVHYVACNQDNLVEKAMYYLENEEERKTIIENGYNFIHSHHTNDVRAQDLIKAIQDLLAQSNS